MPWLRRYATYPIGCGPSLPGDEVAGGVSAGDAAGFVEQHQGRHAHDLGVVDEIVEHVAEAQSFAAQVGGDQVGAVVRRIDFVEQQLDNLPNTIEADGPIGAAGDFVKDG